MAQKKLQANDEEEQNLTITLELMEYIREAGCTSNIGLSRKRTLYGESYEEWFAANTSAEEVIRIFTENDPALHYKGLQGDRHIIRNGDWRMRIMIRFNEERNFTSVWVWRRPDRWSHE